MYKEPDRLLLIWEDRVGNTYNVGEIIRDGETYTLNYFMDQQDYKDAQQKNFQGYYIFDTTLKKKTWDVSKFKHVWERRLSSCKEECFELHKIDPEHGKNLSDFALLGYTGGKLLGDRFSFSIPKEDI